VPTTCTCGLLSQTGDRYGDAGTEVSLAVISQEHDPAILASLIHLTGWILASLIHFRMEFLTSLIHPR
jgi:hypothetical protein